MRSEWCCLSGSALDRMQLLGHRRHQRLRKEHGGRALTNGPGLLAKTPPPPSHLCNPICPPVDHRRPDASAAAHTRVRTRRLAVRMRSPQFPPAHLDRLNRHGSHATARSATAWEAPKRAIRAREDPRSAAIGARRPSTTSPWSG